MCMCECVSPYDNPGDVDWEACVVHVHMYSDHAFILVISTEKYVCSPFAWVSVCIILCERACVCV